MAGQLWADVRTVYGYAASRVGETVRVIAAAAAADLDGEEDFERLNETEAEELGRQLVSQVEGESGRAGCGRTDVSGGEGDISSSLIIFASFGLTLATRDDVHGHSFAGLVMFKQRNVNKSF